MNIELYRKLLLLVTSIFVLQFIYGQSSNRLDSLIQVLHVTPDHKDKARLLLKISKGEELSDPLKSTNRFKTMQDIMCLLHRNSY